MKTMRAVLPEPFGEPENLNIVELPIPVPQSHEVLIEVHAAGLNRLDLIQRKGFYPPPPGCSDVLGVEVSGVIVDMGQGVQGFALGERVMALIGGGGYADYVVADAGSILPVPKSYTFVEGATTIEAGVTVWYNVFERAKLAPNESFLVHGGASGIGTWAIQMAKQWGAKVYASAGSAPRCELCEEIGAAHAIDYKRDDFVQVIKDTTAGKGVNVILDMVGGDYTLRNIDACAVDGRITQIAFLGGKMGQVDFQKFNSKRLQLMGSTLRAQSLDVKAQLVSGFADAFMDMLEMRKIVPVVDCVFDFEDVVNAHKYMESGDHAGKIALKLR